MDNLKLRMLLILSVCTCQSTMAAAVKLEAARSTTNLMVSFLMVMVLLLLFSALYVYRKIKSMKKVSDEPKEKESVLEDYLNTMDSQQIEAFLKFKKEDRRKPGKGNISMRTYLFAVLGLIFCTSQVHAQGQGISSSFWTEGGAIITMILIAIPIIAGLFIFVIKIRNYVLNYQNQRRLEAAERLSTLLRESETEKVEEFLLKRKKALDFSLSHQELSGNIQPEDSKGLLQGIDENSALPLVSAKKRAVKRPPIDRALAKLILWFIGTATFWLLFGTTVGEYLGIKFVSPDVDQVSWLSFGRLRPVHTNAVFWGWASLAMLGLGFYVVPRVSNTPLKSIKSGWYTLCLINAAVVLGTLCLMGGLNNGGGEYREYIWPVMLLFGIGLLLALINFLQTIAHRTTKEIYIANWYIVASVIFAIIIAIVAYVPIWQDGLGETIIQGYYMHQGVGMWFMLFTLGIVYYFLPQQLNKPIYSYSLGILAFWAQILFYTVIGTHHFVFSAIPWWLQTTAIVGSVGMVIPVVAGTTNFLLTFKGAGYKISSSYTLPFFLIGIIFYFTGSLQGTAEAFRSTNLIWHFTDFTVAHSHLTMYGIICFFLWAAIYAVVPRLTGKEAPQVTVGAHFWLALIGLLFYTIPLMYGSTLKGMMWMQGKPFIESVVFMAPFWLWRAIGGSLMWLSHLFFAYNLYKMLSLQVVVDVSQAAIEKLNQAYTVNDPKL